MVNMRRVFIDLIHGQCSSQWGLIEFPQSMSFVRSLVPRPRTLPTTPKHLVAVCYMSLDTVASSDQSIPSESVLTTSRKPWVRPCTRPDQRRGLTTLNSSPALLPSCAIAVLRYCRPYWLQPSFLRLRSGTRLYLIDKTSCRCSKLPLMSSKHPKKQPSKVDCPDTRFVRPSHELQTRNSSGLPSR